MAKKESEDYEKDESGWSLDTEDPVEEPEVVPEPVPEPEPKAKGPVFTRGPDGRLVDES